MSAPTWYTWLEQGRGGAPSADVLDRIARALMLTDVEREHLFLLGLGRPPEVRYRRRRRRHPAAAARSSTALEPSPALVEDVDGGHRRLERAASVMLTDYGPLPPEQRNMLRLIFCDPRVRAGMLDWEHHARFVVGGLPRRAARAGASERGEPLIAELSRLSPEFRAMWRDNAVAAHGEGTSTSAIPYRASSRSNIPPSPSTAGRTSASSSTRPPPRPTPSACGRWSAGEARTPRRHSGPAFALHQGPPRLAALACHCSQGSPKSDAIATARRPAPFPWLPGRCVQQASTAAGDVENGARDIGRHVADQPYGGFGELIGQARDGRAAPNVQGFGPDPDRRCLRESPFR